MRRITISYLDFTWMVDHCSQGQEELRTQLKNGLDDMMTFVSETEQAQVKRVDFRR